MDNDAGGGGVLRVYGCSQRHHSIGLLQKVLDLGGRDGEVECEGSMGGEAVPEMQG